MSSRLLRDGIRFPRGGVFAERQPHQRDAVRRDAIGDGAIHQLQLLLVQPQCDDGLGHQSLLLAATILAKSRIQDLACRSPFSGLLASPPGGLKDAGQPLQSLPHCRLSAVSKVIRSATFGRPAADNSSASAKIAASCVRYPELSYARF